MTERTASSAEGGTTRFSVNLDSEADGRFERLVRGLADDVGRVPSHRGRRYPSRADLLRAMLAVTERDAAVRTAVHDQVLADHSDPEAR